MNNNPWIQNFADKPVVTESFMFQIYSEPIYKYSLFKRKIKVRISI